MTPGGVMDAPDDIEETDDVDDPEAKGKVRVGGMLIWFPPSAHPLEAEDDNRPAAVPEVTLLLWGSDGLGRAPFGWASFTLKVNDKFKI